MEDDKKIVLCIDDDDDVITTLRIILEQNNYKVLNASTEEEGLQIFKEAQPDVIIVDLMMEEVDSGINFVKEVRAIASSIPVFMLSSVGDQLNQTTDYSGLGLSGVFQKPIDADALIKALKSRLD